MAKGSKSSEKVTVFMQIVNVYGEACEEAEIASFKNRRWATEFFATCKNIASKSVRFRIHENGEDEFIVEGDAEIEEEKPEEEAKPRRRRQAENAESTEEVSE